MKAIVFEAIGLPSDVLQIRDVPVPEINDGEVLVRMVATSINPGDFLFIQNLYPEPKRPVFPAQIAGNHGAGIVEEVGEGVSLSTGAFVAFSHVATWAEYAAIPGEYLMPLEASYPVEKAAQFMNFITAWDLVEGSGVQAGQWLVITAGNSTVATIAGQFAARGGVNVIAIVRRAQQRLDLKPLGTNEVIELSKLDGSVGGRIMEITQGRGVHGVIDSVGGPLVGELVKSLAFGGKVVLYGGYSPETFQLHNFDLLMKGAEIGTYVYRYFFDPPTKEDATVLRKIAEISGSSDFRIPIGGMHDLADFKTAIEETIHRPEVGKRFFRMPLK